MDGGLDRAANTPDRMVQRDSLAWLVILREQSRVVPRRGEWRTRRGNVDGASLFVTHHSSTQKQGYDLTSTSLPAAEPPPIEALQTRRS